MKKLVYSPQNAATTEKCRKPTQKGMCACWYVKTANKSLTAEERPESRRREWQTQNYQTLEKVEISHRQRCKMVSREKKIK